MKNFLLVFLFLLVQTQVAAEVKSHDLASFANASKRLAITLRSNSYGVAASPDSTHMVFSCFDDLRTLFMLYNLVQGSWNFVRGKGPCRAVAFTKDSKQVVAGYQERISVWDIHTLEEKVLVPRAKFCEDLKLSPDNTQVATATPEGLFVYGIPRGDLIKSVPLSYARCVAYSNDGIMLAVGDDCQILMYNDIGSLVFSIPNGLQRVYDICFLPSNNLAISAKKYLDFWKINAWIPSVEIKNFTKSADITLPCVETQNDNNKALAGVACSTEGRYIAYAAGNHVVYFYDTQTNSKVMEFNVDGYIQSLQFTPDGNYLACAVDQGRQHIWPISLRAIKIELLKKAQLAGQKSSTAIDDISDQELAVINRTPTVSTSESCTLL